jgi:hypothetical protein
VLFALLLAVSARAQAIITVNFESAAIDSQPAEQFAGLGVHFSSGSFGIVGGIGNGDPGNWSLDGTDGSKFLGFNGPYSVTITFDTPVAYVSVDAARSNGSQPGDTFTLTAFNASSSQIGTQTVTLGAINSWQAVALSVPNIKSVVLTGGGISFHPYGVDRIQFSTVSPIPEPATVWLLGVGLGLVGLRVRRHFGM